MIMVAVTQPSRTGVPTTIGFLAHKGGTVQTVASGSFIPLTFSTKVFDLGNRFSNNAWTPPAGRLITLTATANLSGAGTRIVSIFKNGAEFARGNQIESGAGVTVIATDMPNGTDVYTMCVFQNSGSNADVSGNSPETRFSGISHP